MHVAWCHLVSCWPRGGTTEPQAKRAQLFSTRPQSAQAVSHEVQPAEPRDRTMSLSFAYLADRLEAVPQIARWWFDEWGHTGLAILWKPLLPGSAAS